MRLDFSIKAKNRTLGSDYIERLLNSPCQNLYRGHTPPRYKRFSKRYGGEDANATSKYQ